MLTLSLTALAQKPETQYAPLKYFANLPACEKPRLSPDVSHLAATLLVKGKQLLVVQKLMRPGDKEKEAPVVISSGEYFFNGTDGQTMTV